MFHFLVHMQHIFQSRVLHMVASAQRGARAHGAWCVHV